HTRFHIASITKMFTAVSIMQLEEHRRIDLNATVAVYLPTAPYANQITVRELLQHTSGLWNYGDAAFNSGAVTKPTTPEQILKLAGSHPLTSNPGTRYTYSNTGYVVLGLIVEHVSGQSLAAYERTHIFDPADMHDTTFGNPAPAVPMAVGYMSGPGPVAAPFDSSWLFADGDIVSTAADVARFDIALLAGRLVSPATFALMQSQRINTESAVGDQGLGLEMQTWRGIALVGHHGGVPGFETENATFPASDAAVVVMSDAFDFATPSAVRFAFTALFPSLNQPVEGEDAGVTERFRTALNSLLNGDIDRTQYTAQVNSALTPALLAQTAAQLKPLGSIKTITYLGKNQGGTGTVYSYDVLFTAGKTMTWQFALDADGKIAAIGSSG
ncbi:MAG: beta-lactamase family protein, partial [Candidatus Eremiobacteraeota bacterium]|nr:beta-lactamase family protein [Candidatus Eremiobacteraeota bacterium]